MSDTCHACDEDEELEISWYESGAYYDTSFEDYVEEVSQQLHTCCS